MPISGVTFEGSASRKKKGPNEKGAGSRKERRDWTSSEPKPQTDVTEPYDSKKREGKGGGRRGRVSVRIGRGGIVSSAHWEILNEPRGGPRTPGKRR